MAGRLTGRRLSKCLSVWSVRYTGISAAATNGVLCTFRFQIPPELPVPEEMTKSA